MGEKKSLFCDRCGHEPAEPWVIGRVGRPLMKVDLCGDCEMDLISLSQKGEAHKPGDRRPYKRFEKVKVQPLHSVE